MSKGIGPMLTLACSAAWLGGTIHAQQPTTNARTLQQWAEVLNSRTNPTDSANAKKVIEYLGTNAIPSYLKWIAYDPGQPVARWPNPNVDRWPDLAASHGDPRRELALANAAVDAFRILGPVGLPAIPGLSNIVVLSPSRHSSPRVVEAIGYIGPAALPTLLAILTNGPPSARSSVPLAIAGFGTNATPAMPTLIQCLTNSALREPTLKALTYLALNGVEPQLVHSALANLAHDPDPNVRRSAVQMLDVLTGTTNTPSH